MPRERKTSTSDDSDGGSSSDETSGSSSSAADRVERDHKKKTKTDSAVRSKGNESNQARSKRSENSDKDDDKELRKKEKNVSDSGELSSSDGERIPRSGPKSTVVQKMTTPSKEKSRKRDEVEKATQEDESTKEKSREKHESADTSRSKKRSRSPSPRNRNVDKRFKDDWSYDRSSGRRDDHRSRRDDRDSERDRNWRRDSDRRRMDDRKRDDERRSDRSRRDVGRDRSDRRRDRDAERKDDHNSEREGGEKKREKDNKENDKGDSRHEEAKKDTSSELQKSKTAEVNGEKVNPEPAPSKKPKDPENIMNRTGGAYIPPAKLRMMQAEITDKSSEPFQRMAWEALRKSINGLINKVNVSNIIDIVRELFQENIVRGRGLLARSMIQAQAASPTFTHVYAALVAIINTKFPQIGNLILQRLILQFKRGYRRNDKTMCLSSSRFISHLVNQQVAHELVSLEILTLLLENVTEDSVEVAISLLKECGQKLTEVSPRGVNAIFERLRSVLHEGTLEKRVQYMVEVMFAIRKDGFKDHPSIISDLDLVEEDDQFTHLLQLDEVTAGMEQLNVFKADDNYLENEDKYKELKKEILDEGSTDDEGSEGELGSDDSSDEDEDEEEEEGKQDIVDQTETNMVALRRTIYLTIQSSLDYEECAHKLLKMELKPGQETELCYMIVDCCAQLRTYEKFFGLLAQRFCHLDKKYMDPFQNIFREQFETIHRLETNKLRNVAKFFAHLLHTDAISWSVMSCMKLTEEDTTSASRIYIKILFLELSEYLGLPKLNSRLRDPTLQECFGGILPRNNPKDTRFAINFFTTIGLGGLTEDLREHLKGISKQLMQQKQQQEQQLQQKEASSSSSDSSDSDSSDSDSSDSSDSGSSESSDSDSDDSESSSEPRANKKKKKKKNPKVTKTRSPRTHSPRDHRKADQPDERRFQRRPESAQQVNGRGSESRPRIVDKLLELSLPKGMSLVDPPDLENWNKRGQDKHKKMSRRNRHSNAERSQRRRNSDRELHGMGSYEQGPDRSYYHGERDDIRGRAVSPLPLTVRQGRQQDGFDILADRRGNRRDLSPVGAGSRRDLSDRHDNYPRRSDRRDLDLTPPPRGMDRHAMASPPVRQDRRDYTSPPPSRHQDRMDMITGIRDSYDRRNLDIVPLQLDRRNMDSPARYQNSRDPESPSHNPVRRRDALSPPLRAGRREMESPSCRIDSNVVDSPPKRAGRGDLERDRDDLMRNIERGRDVERGRGDLPRSLERGRAEMDRSRGRGDADRGLERGRRDRVDADRAMDRRMDVDRNLEQGRGNVDRLIERGRGDLDRSLDRPRGDLDRSMDRVRSDVDRGMDRTRVEMDRIMDRARVDVDRGLDRSRGDMDRGMDRARVDGDRAMERVRGDLDHNIDRGRGDVERVRLDLDRSRIDLDRRRGLDRNLDRSGRGELDNSPPSDRRDMPPSPPLANRREMGHTDMLRNADRRRGLDEQQYGEIDGRGGRRSASPAVRKKVRARNEDSLHRRSSVSRDVEEKRKPSGRTEQEVSRERIREKRRR